jgi:hypothetical protein
MLTPLVVEFPLRGQWFAPNTPGTKVPSHGTDLLGATYAYDFIGLDARSGSMHFFRPGWVQYLIFGVRLQDFFGWGQPIFSATTGTVVQAQDGWPERNPVHPVRDFLIRVKNARAFTSKQVKDYRILAGNFIIIETSDGYAVYAHAQTGSIVVSPGEEVSAGQRLANVGHSGNSTAPHLHFQMMDHPDPWQAQGLPCSFREYEVFQDGAWHLVQDGIPNSKDRIRKR